MRDYAQISPRFWTGETGKRLRGHLEAQLVAVYLMSAPGSHMIGMYPLELPTLCHHTGIHIEGATKGLARLAALDFAYFDDVAELIWVPEMAHFQIAKTLKRGDNRIKGVEKELENYRKSRFFNLFLDKYAKDFSLRVERDPERPPEGAVKPLLSQEQEQEQDQEQERKEGGEPAKGPGSPQAPPLVLIPPQPLSPLLAYLAIEFSQAKADPANEKAWAEAFPGIDLLAEAKNARRWELDNPTLIKTQKRRFLGNWFAKAQNNQRAPVRQPQRRRDEPVAAQTQDDHAADAGERKAGP